MDDYKLYYENINIFNDKNIFNKYYDLASLDRKNKIDGYKFDKDKKLSLLSEILLKKALKEYCDIKNVDHIKYEYNKYGKPFLKDYKDIYFNISHSGNYAAVVMSKKEAGIDIQEVKDIDLNIAKRFFIEEEYEKIISLKSDEERKDLFFRYWTIKESFIKAIGIGLSFPLNDVKVNIPDISSEKSDIKKSGIILSSDKTNSEYIAFCDNSITNYKMSICIKNV